MKAKKSVTLTFNIEEARSLRTLLYTAKNNLDMDDDRNIELMTFADTLIDTIYI